MTRTASQAASHASVAGFDAACEEAFCRLIVQRTGIVLQDHQLSNLREAVFNGCERFVYSDAEQYLDALQQSQGLTAPLEYLIAGVTVDESYFFRDSEQIELLRSKLLPEMIAAKRASGELSLRVWSAGCSQGQELYTIALLLHELIPDIEEWHIHLLGTDINSEVVGKAMRGVYSEWSFRTTPMALRERWFVRVGNDYEIHSQIRRMVRFAYLNLATDFYPSIFSETNAMDLILCRNVFIYLDRQAVRRCMAQYAHCLLDHGVLMLGASDPIDYKHTEFELVQTGLVGYFCKKCARDTGLQSRNQNAQALTMPIPGSQAAELPLAAAQNRVAQPLAAARLAQSLGEIAEIIKLLNCSDWAAVLTRVDASCRQGNESSDLWQMKAEALANLGRMDEAQQACVRSLQMDPANKHAYLIQGLILAELGREQEAEEALRKTLYLDRSFLEAHYALGMLRVRAGDLSGALKNLGNALKLAQAGDPGRELHNAAGMTSGRFAQVLQNEIKMLGGAAGDGTTKMLRSAAGDKTTKV